MSETADARDGHLDQAEFKKKMLSQLQSTGVVGQVKSQLRAQLLSQLQKGQIVQLGPPPGDRPGLKRHALNSMIADYFGVVQYNYSLSVFKEESGVDSRPLLTEEELLDVLKIDRDTSFFQSYMKSKAHGGTDSCFILNILNAISEAAAAKGKETFTQTIGGDRYQMEMRMMQLENEYQARLREARLAPGAGMEERLALYRQEIEEQAAAEVARQVERIREMEVAAARLDEASKARRAMEAERLELDRLHQERLTKLRQREEEMMDKLRRQQRDVENVAYEYRQRILREEERLRNHKTEMQQQDDSRQEQLKQLERSLELRERAVAAREAAAEKKLADATEAAAEAQVAARQDVEREYLELKNNLAHQRMQIEMDRSRLLELRSEATAELAAARAKEDRLRALETARAEAEARAAAHAADAEVCRLQAEKLALELGQVRDELSRRLAQAAEGADAMLQNAAGAMNMLNAEAVASRAAGSQIRDAMTQLERAREEAAAANATVAELQQERAALQAALQSTGAEADALRKQIQRVEALLDEAVAARAAALSSVEEGQFRLFQQEREISDLRGQLNRTKEEVAALRLQLAVRRPPSRGVDSPSRRSITISPPRRPPPGAAAAAISALSLGVAFGGGSGGGLAGGGGGGGGGSTQHGWNSGGGSLTGGTPALSNVEFPIAAAPREPRDPTIERLERLRRQEDIVANQEETFRKRMSIMQEVRNRGLAMLNYGSGTGAGGGGGGGSPMRFYSDPQGQQLPPPYMITTVQDGSAPYMTYVMHSSPTHHTTSNSQLQQQYMSGSAGEELGAMSQQDQDQQEYLYAFHQQQQHHNQQIQQQLRQEQDQQRQQQRQQAASQQQQQQEPEVYSVQGQQMVDGPTLSTAPSYGEGRYSSGSAGAGGAGARLHSAASGGEHSWASAKSRKMLAVPPPSQQLPSQSTATGVTPPAEASYNPHGGLVQAAASFLTAGHSQRGDARMQPDPPSEPPPVGPGPFATATGSSSTGYPPAREEDLAPPPAALPPPVAPPHQPVVLPPPGLVLTSDLRSAAATGGGAATEPPLPPPPPPAPSEPPKITIPGLVIVSGFTPRAETTPAAAPPPPQPAPEPSAEPSMPQDVESMMQAKMRMLQEQRERALAAQQTSQRNLTSRVSISSRNSGRSGPSPGASLVGSPPGGGPPRPEDSNSDLIAGEAYDTVAPELSTIQRRATLGRRTSFEGGHGSRQSSMKNRDLGRGSSVRSEASGMSVEAPALGGPSQKALSAGMTLDDIPSSLEGYELPGLNDDDDALEAGGDEDHYGGFAAEMSAGSVF